MKYVVSGLLLLWAIWVYFFSGKKYMEWWSGENEKRHSPTNLARFKILHSILLLLLSLLMFLSSVFEESHTPFLLTIPVIALYAILRETWCRRRWPSCMCAGAEGGIIIPIHIRTRFSLYWDRRVLVFFCFLGIAYLFFSMMASISAGVTTNGFLGKCLMFCQVIIRLH